MLLALLLACATDVPLADTADVTLPAYTEVDEKGGRFLCLRRTEMPQAAFECRFDDECGTGGCSGEVCTTADVATEIITTCEYLPCFARLHECGCHMGRCTWTLDEG